MKIKITALLFFSMFGIAVAQDSEDESEYPKIRPEVWKEWVKSPTGKITVNVALKLMIPLDNVYHSDVEAKATERRYANRARRRVKDALKGTNYKVLHESDGVAGFALKVDRQVLKVLEKSEVVEMVSEQLIYHLQSPLTINQ